MSGVITRVQFSEGPSPKICEGEKNVQNSAQFLTTFNFDRKYLRNGLSYRKSEKNHYQLQPLPRWAKKLVNFGPQTIELKWLILTNPSGHFSGDYISAIRGCCPLKFLHALEIDPGYLAHTPTGTGVHTKNFNRENLKFGLKFRVWATITPDLVEVSSWNFFHSTCRRSGLITRVQFSEGPPPKICEGEKTSKIRRNVWQLSTLIAIIFGTDHHVESRKIPLSTATPCTLGQKMGELWSTNNRVKVAHIDQPKWTFFGRLHFGH